MIDTLLAGIIHGNTYALVAIGLSLIFGVSNVVNFAQGSVFAVGTMSGWWLIAEQHWPLWAAIAGVCAFTAVLGLAVNLLAVRPLAKVPPIAALLATYAVSVVLDNLSQVVFGPDTRRFPQALDTLNFHVGGFRFGTLDVVMFAVSVGCILLLGGFLKFTKYGQAIRATAQDSDAALQMGVPVGRVRNLSFMLASALGGLAGVLVGMYNSNVSPSAGTAAGLTAFTAATLGGLGNLPGAVLGGLALGIVEAFGISYWGAGVDNLIIFGVLLLVLWVRPGGLLGKVPLISAEPLTGTFLGGGRPFRLRWWHALALVGVAAGVVPWVADDYQLTTGTQVLIFAILALSLTLVSGSAAQVSLGQAGPMAVGAYTSALLAGEHGWPFLAALFAAGLAAAVVGTLLMSPTWRLSGHYVSIATLGIGAVTVAAILNLDWLTHGPLGITAIPPPSLFGHQIITPTDTYLLDLTVLLVALGLVVRLQKSFLGTIWSAVGADETALSASGLRPADYKALAYAVGAFVAGLAGSLLAHQYSYLDPTMFGPDLSMLALTIIVLGGMNSPFGAVLGAVVLVGAPEVLRMAQDARLLTYGVLLLLLIRFRPQGLWARRA
ncbi:ABC transporter permease [Streptomyces sp. NPDC097640]|uniref:ABC transporter permease n=1 Tax=Streptomyces sp. NPDC097640 TaxID=3157229 RepID=UPI003322C503